MSLDEVGEIYYFSNNIIVWRVPDFSSLPLREGSRIYSPLFCFAPEINRNFPQNPSWYFEPLKGYVGLIVTSKKYNDRPRDMRMEFGVLNRNNTESGNFTGEWMDEEESTGYFRIRSLIAGENVGGIYTTSVKKVYIRIFAEASSKEINSQKRNVGSLKEINFVTKFSAHEQFVDCTMNFEKVKQGTLYEFYEFKVLGNEDENKEFCLVVAGR